MDLTKLTSAPWKVAGDIHLGESGWCTNETDLEFIEVARIAFDVMIRRGWGVIPVTGGWQAVECRPGVCGINSMIIKSDPFAALVEADKWYRENIETYKG
jgi:hypothetical protein